MVRAAAIAPGLISGLGEAKLVRLSRFGRRWKAAAAPAGGFVSGWARLFVDNRRKFGRAHEVVMGVAGTIVSRALESCRADANKSLCRPWFHPESLMQGLQNQRTCQVGKWLC
jgi:hypothetical protein